MEEARILINTGDGKGKTTAAMGLALRALGHDKDVCIVQFIKAAVSGELRALKLHKQVTIQRFGLGFVPAPSSPYYSDHQAQAQAGLQAASAALLGSCSVLVLDEICTALSLGLLEENAVLQLLALVRPGQIVVLTGRGATPALCAVADTVTEMRCQKHAYQAYRASQDGVEQ